ncbi:helix-hairpin-helix domain-containing protein [Quadrisphaera sp. KR29]|uniref:helix-hairpin-helix domain-containing protein n=1 Tax=Quadrisphaera sp. KR29 TaxID=3461391 RepID=UPI004044F084
MLDGAPGPGWEDDGGTGSSAGARPPEGASAPPDGASAPPAAAALRNRSAVRAASRRDLRAAAPPWQPSVAERLREARWSLGPSAAAGALLVLAAAAVLLVLSAGSAPSAVPTPTPAVAVPARTPAPEPSGPSSVPPEPSVAAVGAPLAAAAPAPAEVVVDVAGQVAAPGLVRLPAGARVDDAVRAAGGALPGADVRRVNLARVLLDGEQVVLPAPGEELPAPPVSGPAAAAGPVPPAAAADAAGGGPGGAVDLNSATLADLDALPGVGPVLAQRLLDWRAEHGRFSSVEEIGEVPGFGPAALERLTPLLAVDP